MMPTSSLRFNLWDQYHCILVRTMGKACCSGEMEREGIEWWINIQGELFFSSHDLQLMYFFLSVHLPYAILFPNDASHAFCRYFSLPMLCSVFHCGPHSQQEHWTMWWCNVVCSCDQEINEAGMSQVACRSLEVCWCDVGGIIIITLWTLSSIHYIYINSLLARHAQQYNLN